MSLAFQPLKIGIQRFVDWLLFRTKHEEMVRRMERLEEEARQTEKLRAVAPWQPAWPMRSRTR